VLYAHVLLFSGCVIKRCLRFENIDSVIRYQLADRFNNINFCLFRFAGIHRLYPQPITDPFFFSSMLEF